MNWRFSNSKHFLKVDIWAPALALGRLTRILNMIACFPVSPPPLSSLLVRNWVSEKRTSSIGFSDKVQRRGFRFGECIVYCFQDLINLSVSPSPEVIFFEPSPYDPRASDLRPAGQTIIAAAPLVSRTGAAGANFDIAIGISLLWMHRLRSSPQDIFCNARR